MICEYCRHPEKYVEGHAHCAGGTWCDCQHLPAMIHKDEPREVSELNPELPADPTEERKP